MSLLELVTVPDQRLNLISRRIEQITPEIVTLAHDMAETMYAAPGIGLAAIQVGVPLQLITIDIEDGKTPDSLLYLINPRIVENSGRMIYEEGCLSVPGVFEEVERFSSVVVEYQDLTGATKRLAADGMLAVVVQHEIDHTRGILFTDHLENRRRARALRKCRDFQRDQKLAARKAGQSED